MTVSGPGGPEDAQKKFEDPNNHDRILEMHLAGTPFLDMASQLGVTISPDYTKLIQGLSDDDVKKIRTAMIEALQAGRTEMPYSCSLKTIPASVRVTTRSTAAGLWADVEPVN